MSGGMDEFRLTPCAAGMAALHRATPARARGRGLKRARVASATFMTFRG
jgi:hypothetical protein